jgi:hypothetical protein
LARPKNIPFPLASKRDEVVICLDERPKTKRQILGEIRKRRLSHRENSLVHRNMVYEDLKVLLSQGIAERAGPDSYKVTPRGRLRSCLVNFARNQKIVENLLKGKPNVDKLTAAATINQFSGQLLRFARSWSQISDSGFPEAISKVERSLSEVVRICRNLEKSAPVFPVELHGLFGA